MRCSIQWCDMERLRGSIYCAAHTRDHARIRKAKDKAGEAMPSNKPKKNEKNAREALQ